MDFGAGPTVFAASAFPSSQNSPHPSVAPAPAPQRADSAHHICTVTLEDYFHAAPLRRWIPASTWYRFESRLASSTRRTLDFLESCGVRATFFVGDEIVEGAPDLAREIAARGHEVAVRGDLDLRPTDLGPARTREEVLRSREELEQVIGRRVYGYRAAAGWLRGDELWLLEVLGETGYAYDSSIRPAFLSNPLSTWSRRRRVPSGSVRGVLEIPLSSVRLCGLEVPIAGGAALRLLPRHWLRRAVTHWTGRKAEPYVLYLRPWELDPEQPRIDGASATVRLRQYQNLERMPARLRELLTAHRFTSVASHLGLEPIAVSAQPSRGSAAGSPPRRTPTRWRTRSPRPSGRPREPSPVTVVVPCYNETQSLRYLQNTLASLTKAFEGEYGFTFLFVDDCSTDGTWMMLQELFGNRQDCLLVRHERNQGVAAAIQTGLRHAPTEVVCSIDCDCTYDPHELGSMIPLLKEGVDVVTASPYHPAGRVRNVPGWRLMLSKTLSRLYRLVLRQKLFTYTSCFRVYRKESAAAVNLRRLGFLGVAEMIARLDLAGRRVVEYPTTLEVRVLGQSKMKVLRTVVGHVGLLFDVTRARFSRNGTSISSARS